jgi:uncharacterized protein YukE
MTTLHMEVETVQAAQTSLENGWSAMDTAWSDIKTKVGSVEGNAWQGNSATEFFNIFNDMKTAYNTNLETLKGLADRLKGEITEWQNVAAKFGDSTM